VAPDECSRLRIADYAEVVAVSQLYGEQKLCVVDPTDRPSCISHAALGALRVDMG